MSNNIVYSKRKVSCSQGRQEGRRRQVKANQEEGSQDRQEGSLQEGWKEGCQEERQESCSQEMSTPFTVYDYFSIILLNFHTLLSLPCYIFILLYLVFLSRSLFE